MSTRLRHISVSQFQTFLELIFSTDIPDKKVISQKRNRPGFLSPFIFQKPSDPVPKFIIKNNSLSNFKKPMPCKHEYYHSEKSLQ